MCFLLYRDHDLARLDDDVSANNVKAAQTGWVDGVNRIVLRVSIGVERLWISGAAFQRIRTRPATACVSYFRHQV